MRDDEVSAGTALAGVALTAEPVRVRREPLTLPTYEPAEPSRFPAFLDARVYQGSSGSVYPLPFHERIAAEPVDHTWDAIHLQNRWVSVTVLPELGGRIHAARDLNTGFDFVYRNDVIKPALVGLAGPWISGGVEFNWPQHHRPATYLPTEASIEHGTDGSVTVWCSDHDPFTRMKGMHGICLYPDRNVVEVKVRLHNRTTLTQTFLWWANLAARSHERYQFFFPPDVHYVADHANRATVAFPAADAPYYGVDYPARRRAQRDRSQEPGEPDADRLDWYGNIPVPTSYMVLQSQHGFFGGYDHEAGAGFVHWADAGVSPGKKLWTWGDSAFGHAWEANLADDGAHYVELMAGVYTNNQPDFAFLAPGETKSFSQLWYPYAGLGPVQAATAEAALTLRADGPHLTVGAAVTRPRRGLRLILSAAGATAGEWELDLDPGAPFRECVPAAETAPQDTAPPETAEGWHLMLSDAEGTVLAEYRPAVARDPVPPPAREPDAPEAIASLDQLYLTGVHLAQYRHATRSPEAWWLAALDRDPGDSRCATAMGERRLRQGRYAEAANFLERAVQRITTLNANPRDGEAHYLLGVLLLRVSRLEREGADGPRRSRARDLLERAAWDARWLAAAQLELGRDAARHGQDASAVGHLRCTLRAEPELLAARCALAVLRRRAGAEAHARDILDDTLALDPLDVWARHLREGAVSADAQHHLDVAREYAALGDLTAALGVLDQAEHAPTPAGATHVGPLLDMARAAYLEEFGDPDGARLARLRATERDTTWCLPVTLDDVDALGLAQRADSEDARACALLGSWRYVHGPREEARDLWSRAHAADPADPVVLRNLGLLAHNHDGDEERAWEYYQAAAAQAPDDPQLLHEIDELAQRRGEDLRGRLERLEGHLGLVKQRDDLSIALVTLLTAAGRAGEAIEMLRQRRFQPWEGGEGRALAAWEHAHLAAARALLAQANAARTSAGTAVEHCRAALEAPATLGEARHPLANAAHLWHALGEALAERGEPEEAARAWHAAAAESGDFREMAATPASELTYFSALAARRVGDEERAAQLTRALEAYVETLESTTPRVDYFATSLPQTLLFAEDPAAPRAREVTLLRAQLAILRGEDAEAQLDELLRQRPDHLTARLLCDDLAASRRTSPHSSIP